uniref:Uncharacterized protein n=1 Tax=Anguilla anguilla TaxID=7936 RepID=A0A0E9V5J0_ANGAN
MSCDHSWFACESHCFCQNSGHVCSLGSQLLRVGNARNSCGLSRIINRPVPYS